MRKLDRASVPTPESLDLPCMAVANEVATVQAYYAARTPWGTHHTAYKFRAYRNPDVKAALRQLAGGNCAYCESKIGAVGAREVEHYRPKGGIEGEADHPGYWWLAHAWNNLLPTCRDCNKSLRQHIVTPDMTREEVEAQLSARASTSYGKANQFDVRGIRAVSADCNHDDEDPLLIDPCRRDPALEMGWQFDAELTLVAPREGDAGISPYGAYTIHTCALNRAELVLDRLPALRPMRALRTKIMDRLDNWAGDRAELDAILAEANVLAEFAQPDSAFAGMAAAFIRTFEEEIDRWLEERGLAHFADADAG